MSKTSNSETDPNIYQDGSRKRSREGALITSSEGKASLVYSSSFNSRDMRLMEVPSDVLSHITEGHDLKLIGPGKGGDTVLCTGNKTYSIKKVETSNVSFLVPPHYRLQGNIHWKAASNISMR